MTEMKGRCLGNYRLSSNIYTSMQEYLLDVSLEPVQRALKALGYIDEDLRIR